MSEQSQDGGGTWWKVLVAFTGGAALAALVTYLLVRGDSGRSTESTDIADQNRDDTQEAIDADADPTDDELLEDIDQITGR